MKIRAEFTAYYPSNEGVEGGYYDALGNITIIVVKIKNIILWR